MTETAAVVQVVVPDSLKEPLAGYAARVKELCGANALALAVFGHALTTGSDPLARGVHNVLVLQTTSLDMLRQLAAEGNRFGKWRISAPLVMTPDYIAWSRDTFPLELIEIQIQHVMLFGQDCFESLQFEDEHVRLQCERELKVLVVAMHQGLLASGGHEERLNHLSRAAAEHLLRVLGGLLWLARQREPRKVYDNVAAVEQLVGRKLPGVYASLDTSSVAGWHKYRELYADLQFLAQYADALSKS